MEKVLVSACLLGIKVRYDGNALPASSPILDKWIEEGRVVPVCPEVAGGMGTPRPPAEIIGGDGGSVWAGEASVIDKNGREVTGFFIRGAEIALALCREYDIKVAVLTESSPSCGSNNIYDGRFSGHKMIGVGVTTAALRQQGIRVFDQHSIESADKALQRNRPF